ncbi:MAG: FAD-binding oxidoreductase [Acidobacteriota bacterium]|nr:FAD-binding oxidoreductase [Acidobacteriota bacterium]
MSDANLADDLGGKFQGRLISPDDPDYDEARKIWNGMIDKRPGLIAQCAGTADVVAAVNFARERDLAVAVRGGGHNVSGNAICDDGIAIDLRPMKNVSVDSARRFASAEGGVTWGEYDQATQRHGLASPGGAISSTGIAGLTLGGGFGWLSRSYGLACDNVLSAEVVTAAGEVLTANADENADLFWGIRGGGGNFGVVTRLDFQLQPIGELYSGLTLYPRSDGPAFMRMWATLTAAAPDELSSMAAFLSTPDGVPVVGAFWVYKGTAEEGERVLAPLRAFGSPVHDDIGLKPYTEVQQAFDPGFPAGNRNYWKSCYLSTIDDTCVDTLVDHANRAPSPLCVVGIEHMIGGAVSRVAEDENAFGSRDAEYNLLILGTNDDPGLDDAIRDWARSFWTAAQPFSTGGVYVNYMDNDESGRIGDAYRASHYARLVDLKKKYDPDNLFRLNQNIAPTG